MSHDAYTTLIAGPAFWIQERLKSHDTFRRLRELERSQWLGADALASLQAERLRRFLGSITSTVPYYRDMFRRIGVDPASIRGPEDLSRLPFLTKADIKSNQKSFIAEGARALVPNFTGGSTGEPLQFFVGLSRVTSDVASRCRAMGWWGIRVGDPEIVLWAAPREVSRQDRMRILRDRILRSTLLAADRMTPERMDGYLDTFERVRPVQIFSHGSALSELARHAEERGRRLAGLGIRVAFVTSEQLYDHQRQIIGRVFGCKVANGYGARDAGFVAQECQEHGMHLNFEDVIVELVDEAGAPVGVRKPGQVVVTNLASQDFPFLRYRTGDVAELDDKLCPCGRGLPLLREIHGRADDLLLGLDGSRVPGQAVVHLLRVERRVKAFRIVQEERDRIRIFLVRTEAFPPELEASIIKGVRTRLGEGMQVEFIPVAELPLEASGKYRTVVSRVGVGPMSQTGDGAGNHPG